ncbi:MAG: HesA/MoeB/ThiF family protein [Gammaproteobacteria bacterium]|nr:HesA/MoeB/ThiF family protein [Gammaproteobacteria bacterium]
MNSDQLHRYSRQLLVPEWGYMGQQRIQQAHVLIFGMGGLGSAASLYLVGAGIQRLTLVDPDHLDISNLHRQILYRESDIPQAKVYAARAQLQALNQHCEINIIQDTPNTAALLALVQQADVVLDCTDNFAARFAINHACVHASKPLICGAAIRTEGHLCVLNATINSPCYCCLYPDAGADTESCARNGILGPVVGMIGTAQALETLKLIAQCGEVLDGKLAIFDALRFHWRNITIQKDQACKICGIA